MAEPIKQQDADELEGGYDTWHRWYERGMILTTSACTIGVCWRIAHNPQLSGWWVPLAALLGLLFSDFISGFVHWMFDTWGSVDTPIVGKVAIRTFRHHHVDQKAITRHGWVETNGHNFGLSILPAIIAIFYVWSPSAGLFDIFIAMYCVSVIVFTCFTSQIHKWAHMDHPPRVVQLLQRARLVLTPDHHVVHHTAPYLRNYCITVGWMNGPLRAIRFFETLERVITAITGAVPREDDIGKDAAIEVVNALDESAPQDEALATRDS